MLRVFDRVTKSRDGPTNKNKQTSGDRNSVDSNLSKSEFNGLRSLKKRIKEGSLIICDTDKSKRVCALTRDQYLA